MSAAAISQVTRDAAEVLVQRQSLQTGSRMLAYEIVGRRVGASASWLRKFLADGVEAKEPGLTVGYAILDYFERTIDNEIETERRKIDALKRRIDAATPKTLHALRSQARAQGPGKEGAEEAEAAAANHAPGDGLEGQT